MRTFVAICFLSVWSAGSAACELPSDNSYYVGTMQEERDLTLQALAKSDLVLIGTVRDIRHGRITADPIDRASAVDVQVDQVLVGSLGTSKSATLQANLHHVFVSCIGNEAFWDDQVEQDSEYIFFVSGGQILSASPPARSWTRLGLTGQREIVLSAIRSGR
jgi:hypothetical protein